MWQSSRKDAVNVVGLLLEHGAVKVPAAQAAKYKAIMDLVDIVNVELYKRSLPANMPDEADLASQDIPQ